MTERRPPYYILVDHIPFAVDMMTWGRWFSTNDRTVARTTIDEGLQVCVSTVFLGLDHNFSPAGDPLLFETMCFGPPDGSLVLGREHHPSIGEVYRYSTWKQAEAGHAEVCAEIRAWLDDIKLKSVVRSEQ